MKRFITVVPRQGKGDLEKLVYEAVDNEKLAYPKPTSFPIVPLLNGYVEKGETVEAVLICEKEYAFSQRNYFAMQEQLKELQEEIQATFIQRTLEVSFNDSFQSQLDTFQKLIEIIQDGDELYCCLTYGGKPVPITLAMALRYARIAKKNTAIRCAVYGQINYSVTPHTAKIYDETPLLQIDDILRILANAGVKDIRRSIETLLNV